MGQTQSSNNANRAEGNAAMYQGSPKPDMKRLRELAARGDDKAMVKLADLLRHGREGVPQDAPAAVPIYRQAAECGNEKAICILAFLFAGGLEGVPQDVPTAVVLYKQAVALGNDKAMVNLAILLSEGGEGVEQDAPAAVALYRQAAEGGNVAAMFNLAVLLAEGEEGVAQDLPAAVALYRQAGERGHLIAMANLAILLTKGGEGVEQDLPAALALYRQAAESGNVSAMYNLAVLLEKGGEGVVQDVPAAMSLYRQASESGHLTAMVNLAILLTEGGEGVVRDVPAALALHRQAAEGGSVLAMFNLAVLLTEGGEGVEQDVPAAVSLYRQAVEGGSVLATYNLAILLAEGEEGVAKDVPAAVALYRQAGERGHLTAMVNLAALLVKGDEDIAQDVPAALALYRQAAEGGSVLAMFNLAVLLTEGGEGVEQDVPAAVSLYRQAVEGGSVSATYNLAILLAEGEEGVAKDVPAAVALYRQAGERGHLTAMVNLAALLVKGDEDIAQDVPAALALYRQAAEGGSVLAMFNLAVLLTKGGEGVEQDVPAAVSLYRQAVEGGSVLAMYNLAILLAEGEEGVAKDVPAAVALYRQAGERGHLTAMVNLAALLVKGDEDIAQDVPAALALYRQAAEGGSVLAMFNLAVLLAEGGEGVVQDVPTALALYRQAAEGGDVSAMHNLARWSHDGFGTRRDVSGARELLQRAVQLAPDSANMTLLARLLLSEDVNASRNPAEAAKLLQETLQQTPTYGPALHELAVLYTAGDDGVPQNRHEAARLHSLAASKATYKNVFTGRLPRCIIEAGATYVEEVKEIIRTRFAKPRTCLLLTLGGGGRGKTSIVNSLRGMPFVESHIPTEMADLNKFVLEPGARGLSPEIIAEYDFKENSLSAIASRMENSPVEEGRSRSKIQSAPATEASELAQPQSSVDDRLLTDVPHADVIERVRRSVVQSCFPVGFKGSVVQIWDMAGQSRYEMAHAMVIGRASILVFVTNLERVAHEDTREGEVWLLCHWMQLAHILVTDPSSTEVVIVGTRKDKCNGDILGILKDSLVEQLAPEVYDSWIKTPERDGNSAEIPRFVAIENSQSLDNPESSGLEELEQTVRAAADSVILRRAAVPLRWLALVDKLEREHKSCRRIYYCKEDVKKMCVKFPGFVENEEEREGDVLEGLRCFASMGRLVLFERGDEDWYVFLEVEKIIGLLGKVTAPEEGLKDRLSAKHRRGLGAGRIAQSALFSLWDGYEDEEKKVMLRLFCQFDLLMCLEGDEQSIDNGSATVGVPALMESGWDDIKWGLGRGERDLEVITQFEVAIPNGLIGLLIAHVNRALVPMDESETFRARALLMIRADAALLRVRNGSRVLVVFNGAKRQLYWKFRGLEPVLLARECIRHVEDLVNNPSRLMATSHTYAVTLDCSRFRGGCGEIGAVEIQLAETWIRDESGENLLPTENVYCMCCGMPWGTAEIYGVLWPNRDEPATDIGEVKSVVARKYKVFISHAGPDKLTLAKPLYDGLKLHNVDAFVDLEGLQIHEGTAPEEMERAMGETSIGIFILSPEFAAREWPMRELRHFLEWDKRCMREKWERPVLLPVFFRLSVSDCKQAGMRIYGDDSEHREMLVESGFFIDARQEICSTSDAVNALNRVRAYSGVEVKRFCGGDELSNAAVVVETVTRVLKYKQKKGMLPPHAS